MRVADALKHLHLRIIDQFVLTQAHKDGATGFSTGGMFEELRSGTFLEASSGTHLPSVEVGESECDQELLVVGRMIVGSEHTGGEFGTAILAPKDLPYPTPEEVDAEFSKSADLLELNIKAKILHVLGEKFVGEEGVRL